MFFLRCRSTLILLLLLFLSSCAPHSSEDFREEGESISKALLKELRAIHNKDQLLAASRRLQYLFDQYADLMLDVDEFYRQHPHVERLPLSLSNHILSDELAAELNRLDHFEGGRQILEKCQEHALYRLNTQL